MNNLIKNEVSLIFERPEKQSCWLTLCLHVTACSIIWMNIFNYKPGNANIRMLMQNYGDILVSIQMVHHSSQLGCVAEIKLCVIDKFWTRYYQQMLCKSKYCVHFNKIGPNCEMDFMQLSACWPFLWHYFQICLQVLWSFKQNVVRYSKCH